jgi:hypothetical protein
MPIINIDCSRHCSGHFQVAKAERKYDKGDEKRGGEANKGGGEEGGEGSNEEPNENREEKEEDDMEEIISPASYVKPLCSVKRLNDNVWHSRTRGSKIRQRVDGEDPRPQDNDNAQFFRRIFVIRDLPVSKLYIYMSSVVLLTMSPHSSLLSSSLILSL